MIGLKIRRYCSQKVTKMAANRIMLEASQRAEATDGFGELEWQSIHRLDEAY